MERNEQTKAKLRAAAQAVIARDGWAAASSRAIAREADVNLASINYYFRSKAALLLAALEASVDTFDVFDDQEFEGLGDIILAIETMASRIEAKVVFAACLEAGRDPAVDAVVRRSVARLREQIAANLGSHVERGTVTLVAAMFDGLLLHRFVDPSTDLEGAASVFRAWMNQRCS